jgi:CrcB protein
LTAITLVFVGAGIGGVLRHGVNIAALRAFGPGFPWATLGVNVAGSFVMGILAGWLALKAPGDLAHPLRLFVGVGVLGGFTTFSAFSLDLVILWQRGRNLVRHHLYGRFGYSFDRGADRRPRPGAGGVMRRDGWSKNGAQPLSARRERSPRDEAKAPRSRAAAAETKPRRLSAVKKPASVRRRNAKTPSRRR